MENNLKSSNLGLPDKFVDPLEKLWRNELSKEATKVVTKQGRFGAVDDDEYIGNSSK